jgi:hypothetical protein
MTSSIMPIADLAVERMYLPLVGLFLAAAWLYDTCRGLPDEWGQRRGSPTACSSAAGRSARR